LFYQPGWVTEALPIGSVSISPGCRCLPSCITKIARLWLGLREIRLPFLDYRFVQLLLSLGPELKLRDGWTKWVFRKAMESYLPKSIVWRKDKQGFHHSSG